MLKKLLKYDLRRVSPILLVVHAAILFFSFLSFAVSSGKADDSYKLYYMLFNLSK